MEVMIERMIPCFQEFGVQRAALFGSAARGEPAPQDVDLIVSFLSRSYDLLDLIGLKHALEDTLHLPVDLNTYPSLQNDEFSRNVLRDEQVIYEQS